MQDIRQRELKMQEKRKQTPRRDFVKEICSWRPVTFYKIDQLISRYPSTDRIGKIVGHKEAIEQRDSLTNYGIVYDESVDFFSQMQKLFTSIPLENTLLFSGCENSEFADQAMGAKNSYLSYSIITSENILYTILSNRCTNVFNSISVVESENIYRSHNVVKSYNVLYSKHIDNSHDLRFCTNMIGCQECLFSNDLDNTAYCIYNKQYSKEEYYEKKIVLLAHKEEFLSKFLHLLPEHTVSNSENVSGEYITDCSEMENGYYTQATHNSHNVIFIAGGEGCFDLHDTYAAAGLPGGRNYYGIMGCTGGDNVYNSVIIPRCSNTYYSYGMEACSFCLGCVGLVNKSFCILNKQYTKDERDRIANDIFQKMSDDGTLGQFFPGGMNPFYFNDTTAYLMDESFSKEEITSQGYLRRDDEIKVDIPAGSEVVKTSELSQYQGLDSEGKRQINPEILKKVIIDEEGNSYRVVKMEYDFLMKYGLPLPELHWLERIKLGFKFK